MKSRSLQHARDWIARGDVGRAELELKAHIQRWPEDFDADILLGELELKLGRFDQAIARYAALTKRTNQANVWYGLGVALCYARKFDGAVFALSEALKENPLYLDAMYYIGIAEFEQRNFDAAIKWSKRALTLEPRALMALNNLGAVAEAQQKFHEAIDYYQKALAIDARYMPALNNIGSALYRLGRIAESIPYTRQAIALDPEVAGTHYNLAVALLNTGQFEEGLREYEWRFVNTNEPYMRDPRDSSRFLPRPSSLMPIDWVGKRVLFMQDQGIGDDLFFLRFLHRLRDQGAWLAYQAPERLLPLVRELNLVDQLLLPAEALPNTDYTFGISDAALLAQTRTVADLPSPVKLVPRPDKIDAVKAVLGKLPKPLIGLTWKAGIWRKGSQKKAIALDELLAVFDGVPGTFVILQREPEAADVEYVSRTRSGTVNCAEWNTDLELMLALLSVLDDYVGVSNTNFHLMASLGKAARVLCKYPSDFRWMAEGDQSPWFPGIKVYRQQPDQSWAQGLATLRADLLRAWC